MASAKALEAANAVNSLLHLSPSDQQACLDVTEEFFTAPDELPDDDCDLDGLDDSDPEMEIDARDHEPGTSNIHTHKQTGHENVTELVLCMCKNKCIMHVCVQKL